jgi:alpha-tubulin suppressor-like RCC1 family protein
MHGPAAWMADLFQYGVAGAALAEAGSLVASDTRTHLGTGHGPRSRGYACAVEVPARILVALLAAASGSAAFAVSAAGGSAPQTVTLGNASGEPNSNICSGSDDCTYVPYAGASDPEMQVPFDGTVTSFSVNAGSTGGKVELRVLRPAAGGRFTAVGTGPMETLGVTGINTFSVSVPVEQGDVLALDNESSALVFQASSGSASTRYFEPAIAEGSTGTPGASSPDRLLLSAEVQPAAAGQLYAFGDNEYGALGNTSNDETHEPNPTPSLVTLPGEVGQVTQVAAGENHSLAVTSSGQLYGFGDNNDGQLGNATNDKTGHPNPTPTLVTLPGAGGPVTQVAAGAFFSLAVTSSGQLYAFGENSGGQLGDTTNDKTSEPNPTPTLVTLPGEVGPVIQVAAGYRHSLAVTSSGQLYAFGENGSGQLGDTTHNKTGEPNPTPTLVSLPGEVGQVTQVAAGAFFSLAVTSSGQLYAFGGNYFGQLGNATNDKTGEPNPTPTLVTLPGEVGQVTQVAAGENHSLAVTSSGQLYAFGENYFGQLGDATNNRTVEPNPTPTLVTLPGEVGRVTQVAGGEGNSLAITSSGQLYTFGENYFGQLGDTTNERTHEPNPTPTLVTLPSGATADTLARGPMAEHSLVVLADLAVTTGSLPGGTVGAAYSAPVQASGGAPPYQWSASGMPPGLSINQASGAISGTPTAAGSYTVAVTATDDDGIQASAPLAIAISAVPAAAASVAPVITNARESHSTWREGGKLAQISRRKAKKPPVGTTFSFSLNEQASVILSFTQTVAGRKVGHRCVAKTRHNAKRKACRRTVTPGTLILSGRSGADKIVFQGRISRTRKLTPGRYTLVIMATNAAGQKSKPQKLNFTIVK